MWSCTVRPTIMEASCSSLDSAGVVLPTTFPSRITVTRSAISRTSRSLCEMKMIDVPESAFTRSMTRKKSSISCGVRTAVGSSRISTFAWR